MIDHAHAVRIARRLARLADRQDPLLRPGMVRRMWAMLEATPGAHAAYGCPPDRKLAEHGVTLTPDQLEAAADRLEVGARSPESVPPRGSSLEAR